MDFIWRQKAFFRSRVQLLRDYAKYAIICIEKSISQDQANFSNKFRFIAYNWSER